MQKPLVSFVDIGANLLDPMFQGIYRDKLLHAPDLLHVLNRAKHAGAQSIFITAGSFEESQQALFLAREYPFYHLKSTVGIHPTQSSTCEFHFENLLKLAQDGMKDRTVVAIGECGLDRDRESFSPFSVQLKVWEKHFALCEETTLPMFIHSRACLEETIAVLKQHPTVRGVVHSFDYEDPQGAEQLLSVHPSIYIGINGCSLKTEGNLEMVRKLPLDRLLVESDAPWCSLKGAVLSHCVSETPLWETVNKPEKLRGKEGLATVKSRNEPMNTLHVLGAIATLKNLPLSDVAQVILENTQKLFALESTAGEIN